MAVKTLEERVTLVEHKVAENARRADGLHAAIVELGNRMDRRFQAMDEKMDRRFDALQQQQTSNFRWLVGLLVTAVLTIGAAVAAGASAIVAAVIGR